MNVEELQKKRSVCIGCGLCAAFCAAVTMQEKQDGSRQPAVMAEKCTQCGRCVGVCPFYGEVLSPAEAELKSYSRYLGNYISCWEGYDGGLRRTSASGGIATAFLTRLLEDHVVDAVITAEKTQKPEQCFQYAWAETPEQLLRMSGSVYYPIGIEEVLKKLLTSQQRAAIVGLPCVIRGIRKMVKAMPKLQERIPVLAGLACGGLSTKAMTEYLVMKSGHRLEEVRQLSFREKEEGISCNNAMFRLCLKSGREWRSFYYEEKPGLDTSFGFGYLKRLFLHRACDVCTDALAEEADVTFMDAWLPQYKHEKYGTSLVVCRSGLAHDTIRKLAGQAGIVLREAEAEVVVEAQKSVNLIQSKKYEAGMRNFFLRRKVPQDTSCRKEIGFFRRIRLFLKAGFQLLEQHEAKRGWSKVQAGRMSVEKWEKRMKRLTRR